MIDDGIIKDFLKTLNECDSTDAFYLAQEITRTIEKNRFGLFRDKKGNLTSLGKLDAGIFEMLFVYGYLKKGKGGECNEELSREMD